MGHNEKDKRYHAAVEIETRDGIIRAARIWRPISSNASVWEQDNFKLTQGHSSYGKENSCLHFITDRYKELYNNVSTVTVDNFQDELTSFVNKHNKDYIIETKLNGKSIDYEEFCKAIKKSEALIRAYGLKEHSVIIADDNSINKPNGHQINENGTHR